MSARDFLDTPYFLKLSGEGLDGFKGTPHLLQDKRFVESLGGFFMGSDPGCRECQVICIPIVWPEMYGAVVNAEEITLRNKVLPNLG